jgi:hypothetical protein
MSSGMTLYEKHISNRCPRRGCFANHIGSYFVVGHQVVWPEFGNSGCQRAKRLVIAIQLLALFEAER